MYANNFPIEFPFNLQLFPKLMCEIDLGAWNKTIPNKNFFTAVNCPYSSACPKKPISVPVKEVNFYQ